MGLTEVTCLPASGDFFQLGTTFVICSSNDYSDNKATTTFDVKVVDTTPPTLVDMPADETLEGNTVGGAMWAYSDPSATDIVDANPTVECSQDSGFFPLGTTIVTCTATDASLNSSSDSFDVTVVDTKAPTLVGMPADITVEGNTTGGATVTWADPTATDIVDATRLGLIAVSGSFFASADHTVTCTATDASNNSSNDSFDVTVVDTTPPDVTVPANIVAEATGPSGAAVTYWDSRPPTWLTAPSRFSAFRLPARPSRWASTLSPARPLTQPVTPAPTASPSPSSTPPRPTSPCRLTS